MTGEFCIVFVDEGARFFAQFFVIGLLPERATARFVRLRESAPHPPGLHDCDHLVLVASPETSESGLRLLAGLRDRAALLMVEGPAGADRVQRLDDIFGRFPVTVVSGGEPPRELGEQLLAALEATAERRAARAMLDWTGRSGTYVLPEHLGEVGHSPDPSGDAEGAAAGETAAREAATAAAATREAAAGPPAGHEPGHPATQQPAMANAAPPEPGRPQASGSQTIPREASGPTEWYGDPHTGTNPESGSPRRLAALLLGVVIAALLGLGLWLGPCAGGGRTADAAEGVGVGHAAEVYAGPTR